MEWQKLSFQSERLYKQSVHKIPIHSIKRITFSRIFVCTGTNEKKASLNTESLGS